LDSLSLAVGGRGGDSQKTEFIYLVCKEEKESEGVKKRERWSKRFENGRR
jgi:hypothetical protein